jgi:2-polyprenyl-3-methyl-5-hydroxy-6-metoxy-1,4-benzoquinol methylase
LCLVILPNSVYRLHGKGPSRFWIAFILQGANENLRNHKCNTADKKVTFMNLLKRILVQSKKPSGRFGRFLATGMNFGHSGLTKWGLGFIDIKSDIDVLDIGCGGGKTVKQIAGITTTCTDSSGIGPPHND